MQRYFVEEKNNHSFFLNPEDSYHILTVMRMNLGDRIEIVSAGNLYLCKIVSIDNHIVEAEIISEYEVNNELAVDVTIAQALVKETKMDIILQKTTELGIHALIPYQTTRSVIKIDGKEEKKIVRWQRIVKEASEQSKRNHIPKIYPIMDIDKLCKVKCELKLLCTVNEMSTNIKKVLSNYKKDDRIIIVVGPEGGFTKDEEEKLMNAGYIPVSLGNLILRTETVGLYVMSVINYHFMR